MSEQPQSMQELNQQLDRMVMPFQRVGALTVNGLERMTRFQLGAAQHYNHFFMSQWRNALEIRDQQGLRQFFDKQSEAVRELGQKVAEDTQALASMGHDLSEQAQRVAEQNVRSLTDMTQALERAAEEDVRRASQRAGSAGAARH